LKQNSGIITVDDKPIDHTNMLLWQSLFAYVTNESAILSDSVAANVAYGVPQASIDVDKVNSALRKVGLTGFTEQLSQGIMTPVGDQGKQISAGQKQRLLIARALYRNASIFIFDEAMSQLDARSEQDVLDTISSLRRDGITVIIVAHRQHTLMECSKVYSLTHGKLRLVRKAKQPPKGN
jgi:ABC-type multidrug transport system fused ATPase/permease subunit